MSKILISSLGVGNKIKGYSKANYKIDDKVYEDENFIARVLCEHKDIDRLFIVGTDKSIWDALYSKFGGDEETELKIYEAMENNNIEEYLPIIEEQINKTLGSDGSKCFILNYGTTEEELWQNFDFYFKIAKNFDPKDEIYLDITHSFRSLSLFSFVMSEFFSNVRDENLNIKGVYYGMFEAKKDNIAPIINLAMFFDLLNWSKAIRELKRYGNANPLKKLISNSDDEELKDFNNIFTRFSNAIGIADMSSMQKSIQELKYKIKNFKESSNNILNIVNEELEDFVKYFDVKSVALFQYKLASWHSENKNYALAYTSLAEAIVSAICENENLDTSDKDERQKAKDILYEYGDYKLSSPDKNKLSEKYKKIQKIRNMIAHSLDGDARKTNISPKQAIENIDDYIKDVKELFKDKN